MAPQLKISTLMERKKRCALGGKGNSTVFNVNNGDGLKEMAHIRIVSVTDGWTVHNNAKRYFDEEGLHLTVHKSKS